MVKSTSRICFLEVGVYVESILKQVFELRVIRTSERCVVVVWSRQ